MARNCWRPARKALISTVGIGNLPLSASRVAAIRPRVAAGNRVSASALPSTGITLTSDTTARNMKNSPDIASGWRMNVRMPDLTQ